MQPLPEHGHDPVMVDSTLRHLGLTAPASHPRIIADCTIGRGGHAERIVKAMESSSGGIFIGMDVDPDNLKYARKRLETALTNSANHVQLRLFHANFAEIQDVLTAIGPDTRLDALLADFGVSTNQLLDARHGLSFNADVTLDMRLDPRIRRKASDLVAELDEKELAAILQDYAQERFGWRIARKIVQARASEPIVTTGQLARLVRSVVPGKWGQIDPATRTFQALRMAVNAELDVIEELLAAVPGVIKPGGRCVFLSFHSGEDRLVKRALRGWEEQGIARALTKKPEEPSEDEMRQNPRSRSAKLRAAVFQQEEPNPTNYEKMK
jgi:16S rRNA (cytosine1402-N4)-methyltransferase